MPGRADRIFYAPPALLARQSFPVPDDEAHHLTRVLRVSDQAEVRFVDGEGNAAVVRVTRRAEGLSADVLERPGREPPRSPEVHLAIATNKGSDFEEILTRLAEIGVRVVHPFTAARSVPRGAGGRARAERWSRMARTGMKIAGSAHLMRITPVLEWSDALALPGDCRILCEAGGEPLLRSVRGETVLVLIGPEGGFTDEERAEAIGAGFVAGSLGAGNLRATTAAVLAAGFMMSGCEA
ncbi:MAG: 16S rRNA (uracil(1498)-N(3))-methyltransferase [Gemmatimonadetes bacterium]|nr:16S rRNA (uracil(1498)-N(3))-methyltransferase [Gemmatimonadota bacterium]